MGEAMIHVVDGRDMSEEDSAKLQALYSRSTDSVIKHLDKIRSGNSTDFMQTYYVGYGHRSIADCADARVFVEGVSHPAAKAIQDNPLYNGVEVSTRYVDFAGRPRVGNAHPGAERVQVLWMEAYRLAYEAATAAARARVPGDGGTVAANAVHARGCDVARGFLPLGTTTNLSWKMTLRQFGDQLPAMAHHPLAEVRDVASKVLDQLLAIAPGSFRREDHPSRSAFLAGCALAYHYARSPSPGEGGVSVEPAPFEWRVDADAEFLASLDPSLYAGRPPQVVLPRALSPAGRFAFRFEVDYGAFRDVQRHRNGVCRVPLVEGPVRLHAWYLANVPEDARAVVAAKAAEAAAALEAHVAARLAEGESPAELQYLYPLGQLVRVRLDYDLPQAVYVAEMRSSRHVHETLRPVALAMGEAVGAAFPRVPVHLDREGAGGFHLARGTQTVVWRQ